MTTGVLYISYDGMLEPLGQSQVLAYQERLAQGFELRLLSFEKPEDWADTQAREAVALRMARAGIHWHPRTYHKRPSAPATAFDILVGIFGGLWLVLRHRIRTVHARSYVPAVMALVLKKLTGVRFVFDMRGFWADERVDGGLWLKAGRMYRVAKWFERQFLLNADHVVSLTHAAVQIMQGFDYLEGRHPPYTVIPTCADLERFRPPTQAISRPFVLGYVGTVGTWYLFDEVAATVAALLRMRPDARFIVVNRGEHDFIRTRLASAGVPDSAIEIIEAGHAEVPSLMSRMSAGIFFIKPAYSKQASAPTKLAEFLGCGIPCLANSGVGDMAEVLEGEQIGIALRDLSPTSLQSGLTQLLEMASSEGIQARCTAAAHRHFSLDEGVRRYDAVYRSLSEQGVAA